VNPSNSKWLAAHMPVRARCTATQVSRLLTHMQEAQYVQWEKTGHALHGQWPERFNQLLEDAFREGQQRVRDGWVPAI
jgi:pimeloyl-ACP methyl ester carboxylesterase